MPSVLYLTPLFFPSCMRVPIAPALLPAILILLLQSNQGEPRWVWMTNWPRTSSQHRFSLSHDVFISAECLQRTVQIAQRKYQRGRKCFSSCMCIILFDHPGLQSLVCVWSALNSIFNSPNRERRRNPLPRNFSLKSLQWSLWSVLGQEQKTCSDLPPKTTWPGAHPGNRWHLWAKTTPQVAPHTTHHQILRVRLKSRQELQSLSPKSSWCTDWSEWRGVWGSIEGNTQRWESSLHLLFYVDLCSRCPVLKGIVRTF